MVGEDKHECVFIKEHWELAKPESGPIKLSRKEQFPESFIAHQVVFLCGRISDELAQDAYHLI